MLSQLPAKPQSSSMPEFPEHIGPYRILSKVGEGGMGVVYKAEDSRLHRVVALKVIRGLDADASQQQRFWQEARAAAQVAHPNACRIYDVTEEQKHLVLVMEFIEGESLARRIQRGALPAQEAAQVVLAILSALEAFHKIGIVHRDLKPENIVLSDGGTKLLDFGISKHVSMPSALETLATLPDQTSVGVFLGTPRYASPEQFRGQAVDARSDLFSVGVILFEMLTGLDVVLTGALLNVGEQLRITTQLVEVPSGTLIWSHSSQTTLRELLELHDDLVRRILDSILPSLTAREHQALQHDRPANPTVYQFYLQANELSRKWDNLPAAMAIYDRCVSLDPSYAPAWARLGRARWLWDKYNKGSLEGLRSADEAFQTALRLNPNLALAHNLYTNLQVDQGRSLDAMKRLLERAEQRRSDAELFAGLAHVSRYCGLLQAALAAHKEARRLDPLIATSVNHTYFMLGDYELALEASGGDYGYGRALVLAMLGNVSQAVSQLREAEISGPWRLGRLYLISLRALLEGHRQESLEAGAELMQATFRDPEGMYYMARQFSYLGQETWALDMLARAIDNGFFCYTAMVRDPWFDALRASSIFTALLRKCHQLHREAASAFLAARGDSLLGLPAESY
jgi:serine/threonine protein kinase